MAGWWKLGRYSVVAITCLWISLTGCSALDLIKPNPGIEVETQIGKENEKTVGLKNEGQVGVASDLSTYSIAPETVDAEEVIVNRDSKVVAHTVGDVTIEAPVDFLYLFLLIAGWLAPTPTRIYYIVKGWFKKDGKNNQ